MALNKNQLESVNQSNFPNNNSNYITPALLREFNTDVITSLQLQDTAANTGSNTFRGNQIVSGNVDITGTLTAYKINTIIESSSVIYSSGSNQLGDELSDTQILSGSVYIVGQGYINSDRILTSQDTASFTFNTSSLVTTASFNAYTSSTNAFTSSTNTFTASQITTNTTLQNGINGLSSKTGSYATTGSNTFIGQQNIDKAYKLFTNGVYWNDNTVGYNNLEIVNSGYGNVDISAINGRVRIVNSPLFLTGSSLTSSNDISTSANIYGANLLTSAITASSLVTASVSQSTITFTKGDGSQFNIVVADVSGSSGNFVTTASFNSYTASQDFKNTTFATTSSVNSLSASIFSTDATQSSLINGKLDTSSFTTFSTSVDSRLDLLELSGSGFATTGSNTFIGNQTINGDISASGNISASSLYVTNATIINLTTIYETSSVIYSSGSNQLGDELSDVQILSGSVKVVGGLTVNGVSVSTQSVDISSLNAFTASQIVSNSYFATTGSNVFIGNQTISGSLFVSGSEVLRGTLSASALRVENNTYLDGTLTVTNDTLINGDVTIQSATPNLKLRDTSGGGFSSGYDLRVDTGSFEIYDDTHNRDVLSDFFNLATSKHTTSLTSEIIIISGSDSVTIQGPLTASLQDGYVWVGNSSNKNTNIATSSLSVASAVSASFATNALTASFALNGGGGGSVDTGSFATTGSNTFNGNQTINGIVNINNPIATGNINLQVESGSFTKTAINLQAEKSFIQAQGDLFFLNTWDANSSGSINFQSPNQINFLATSSVTISGSNNVTIRSSNIDVTGSLKVTAGITGSLEGTASYATNALTASFALNGGGGSVDTGSLMRTGSVVGNVLTFTKGDGTTFDLTVATGSGGGSVDTGSFATTGSNIFKGNQVISGSLIGNSLNDGIIFIGSEAYESGSVKANISSSNAISQSNIFFGATTGPAAANLTGSIVISGSNNIMMGGPRPSTIATVGTYGYIGNTNLMMGQSTLSTGSILRPVVNSNIIAGAGTLGMIFTSSSVAGGQPSFTANIINSNFNSNMGASGSISAGGNIINGATTLIQTGSALANLRSTFNNNNINSTFTVQNYQSSSFTVNNNNTVGASHFIDNRFVNTFGTAGITVSRNFFQGQLNYLNIGGTPSSNTTRAAGDSFFGGFNVTGSLLATGTNNGNLSATLIYGNNLNINGTSVANVGGNAFFGRYNDTGSLANSNDIVMAVGTGTAVSTRRTGFYITTGSLVGISGSLDVKGNTTITGSVVLSGSVGPELIVVGDSVLSGSVYGAVNALSISSNTASLNLASGNFFTLALPTGVNTFVSASNVLPGQTINLAITNGGTGTISFSNNVKQPSGSFYTATTGSGVVDVVTLLSVDTNNLYMNNVKNLI